jgi:hypothetical protein
VRLRKARFATDMQITPDGQGPAPLLSGVNISTLEIAIAGVRAMAYPHGYRFPMAQNRKPTLNVVVKPSMSTS